MLQSYCLTCLKTIISKNYGIISATSVRNFFTTFRKTKAEDRREMLASMPAKDEGTQGEKLMDIDNLITKYVGQNSLYK